MTTSQSAGGWRVLVRRVRISIQHRLRHIVARIANRLPRPVDRALLWIDARRRVQPEPADESAPILIIRHRRYVAGSEQESTEAVHLERPLTRAGIPFETLCWGDLPRGYSRTAAFAREVERRNPGLLVLSSYDARDRSQPSVAALREIRRRTRCVIVAVWWDTCSPAFEPGVRPLLDLIDLHIIVDNPQWDIGAVPLVADRRDRFLKLWVPCDPLAYASDLERDIVVSFAGQTSSYRGDRRQVLDAVVARGIPIHMSTADRPTQPSYADYVRTLNRSQMVVNFSRSVQGHQLKARVFEAMLSGALLLESANSQTAAYFRDGIDYVSFRDASDLAEKIAYYQRHQEARTTIAATGRDRVRERFSGERFWDTVFDSLRRPSPSGARRYQSTDIGRRDERDRT